MWHPNNSWVGSFSEASKILNNKYKIILKLIKENKFFLLGICLGMQIMANKGNENGKHIGLGIFNGEVKMIPKIIEKPTIGWKKTIIKNSKLTFLKKYNNYKFYHVHSYYLNSKKNIHGYIVENKFKIPSIVYKKNHLGLQFHPEKSGKTGLKLIKISLKMQNLWRKNFKIWFAIKSKVLLEMCNVKPKT